MTAAPMPDLPGPPDPLEPGEAGLPAWAIPPPEGYTADDIDHLPQLPAHTELIDGGLVFVSPPAYFHMLVVSVLESALRAAAPADYRILREMSVVLGPRQRPEPDVLVVRADALRGFDQTSCRAEDVVLVVEVVSPESEIRDRERKPQLYGRAGIVHLWRVENGNGTGRPTVYVYELDPASKAYALTGIHHDRLKTTVPFDIDIDLTQVDRL